MYTRLLGGRIAIPENGTDPFRIKKGDFQFEQACSKRSHTVNGHPFRLEHHWNGLHLIANNRTEFAGTHIRLQLSHCFVEGVWMTPELDATDFQLPIVCGEIHFYSKWSLGKVLLKTELELPTGERFWTPFVDEVSVTDRSRRLITKQDMKKPGVLSVSTACKHVASMTIGARHWLKYGK